MIRLLKRLWLRFAILSLEAELDDAARHVQKYALRLREAEDWEFRASADLVRARRQLEST